MDELDLIRRFREEVPAPSSAARERALRPLRRRKRAVLTRRRVLLPLAGAALIAAVAIPLLDSLGGGTLPTGTALAAKQLRDVAAAAERQPDPRAIGPGQYWYQRTLAVVPSMEGRDAAQSARYWFVQPTVRERWIGRDGGGFVKTEPRGELRFPAERDRRRWRAAGSPELGKPFEAPLGAHGEVGTPPARERPGFDLGQVDLGAERISYEELVNLPTDPDALLDRLRRAAARIEGRDWPEEVFGTVGRLLRAAPIPSELRAALYRVASRIPGIRPVGEIRDIAGRQGIGVAYDTRHVISYVLIFDPKSGELLGERTGPGIYSIGANDPDAGRGYDEVAYLEEGVVDRIDERP
jgi:hypothetical protein